MADTREYAMIEFSFSAPNANRIHFAFASLADSIKDWRKYIWPQVRDRAIRPWLRRQFAAQGQGAHGPWVALSPKYALRKDRKYPGKPILVASGTLMDSLLSEDNEGEMTPRTFNYGTNVPYGIFQQTGTRRGLPARRIFDPEETDTRGSMKQMIRSSVAYGLSNHARALGFAVSGSGTSPVDAKLAGLGVLRTRGGGSIPVSEGM